MNIKEFIDGIEHSSLWEKKVAIFKDKSGCLQFIVIKIGFTDASLRINVYNEDCEITASLNVDKNRDKNFYFYNLLVERKHRRLNIATHLCELIDFILYDYKELSIIGIFEPFEFTEDRENIIYGVDESGIKEFYKRNGFEIVSYEDYIRAKEKYKDLYSINFGRDKKDILIYKKIGENPHNYRQVGDLILHNNVFSEIDRIREIFYPKILKLD